MLISPLIAGLVFFTVPDGAPAPRGPVVVEMFTSQGCPACPDANVLLGEIAGRHDVIAIAYGVGHMDAFGWADTYARPEFGDRQKAYVAAGEASRVFTPHFVINGGPERVRRSEIDDHLEAAEPLAAIAQIERENAELSIRITGPQRETPAEVWLVAYEPGPSLVAVDSGRNAGREITHHNMAVSLHRLDDWAGGAYEARTEAPGEGLVSVLLVQASEGGPLLAAVRAEP
jgi:hypothetical protein